MKNNMEIREDLKFLMINYQGVLTLDIRRSFFFDVGIYFCRAVNELGEALVECKLEVRGEDARSVFYSVFEFLRVFRGSCWVGLGFESGGFLGL